MPPHDEVSEDDPVVAVVDALVKLRGEHGVLTVQKFSRYPLLVQLLGEGDLFDAFIAFKRELGRLQRGNKFEAAVAWSIGADYETVLDRLQATADALADGQPKDQRTARHWSDRGMEGVARDLIAFGNLRGHTGRDLIGIALHHGQDGGIILRIVQVVSTELRQRAPVVTVVQLPDSGHAVTREVDLQHHEPDTREVDGQLATTSHTIHLSRRKTSASAGRMATISVMARGSPMPTFFLEAPGQETYQMTFAVHRSLVVADVFETPRVQ